MKCLMPPVREDFASKLKRLHMIPTIFASQFILTNPAFAASDPFGAPPGFEAEKFINFPSYDNFDGGFGNVNAGGGDLFP